MKLIVDNNILFSLIKPDSTNSHIFSVLNFEFVSPYFVIREFEKYKDECFRKSGLSKDNFTKRKEEVFNKISFVEFKHYKEFWDKAVKVSPDKDDAPYFALSLKLKCPIWSNDSDLKNQDKVIVLNTRDILGLIF